MKQNNEVLFDKRVVRKNIRDRIVVKDDYDKYLKSLPDRQKTCELVSIETLAPKAYLRKALGIDPAAKQEED